MLLIKKLAVGITLAPILLQINYNLPENDQELSKNSLQKSY